MNQNKREKGEYLEEEKQQEAIALVDNFF